MSQTHPIQASCAFENAILETHQPYVSIISSLTFGRFGFVNCGVSQGGQFSHSYLTEWNLHKKTSKEFHAGDGDAFTKRNREPYIFSPGWGYDIKTLQAMKEAGFSTDPNIAFRLDNYPLWDKDTSHSKALTQHPLNPIKEHFESLGISCFLAQGGAFPDKLNDSAVVFDVSDPYFLQKIKPDFLSYFVEYQAKQLSNPSHIDTQEEKTKYCYGIMKKLREYGEEIGATYEHRAIITGTGLSHRHDKHNLAKTSDRVENQAKHQMEWVTDTFNAMLPVLSSSERGDIILHLVSKLTNDGFEYSSQRQNTSLKTLQIISPKGSSPF